MRRRLQHHAKPVMTKAQNRSAYDMWLRTAPIEVVSRQDPAAIGRCYGIAADKVAADIALEPARRAAVAAQFGGGQ